MPTLEALNRLESQLNPLEKTESRPMAVSALGADELNQTENLPDLSLPDISEQQNAEPPVPDLFEEDEIPLDDVDQEYSMEEISLDSELESVEDMAESSTDSDFVPINFFDFDGTNSGFIENFDAEDQAQEQQNDAFSDFFLKEEDYQVLRQTLSQLPLNLSIAIESLLAYESLEMENLQKLIKILVKGESPKNIAQVYYEITNQRIELPRDYAKRSGLIFEEHSRTLSYRISQEMWPILRNMVLTIALLWVTLAAAFMFVYRPLKAASLYRKGLDYIAENELEEAGEYFRDAWDGWPLFAHPDQAKRISDAPIIVKGWKVPRRWVEYARAFRGRKHWPETKDFYEGYINVKPKDADIRMEYAYFLSYVLADYQRAIRILGNVRNSETGRENRDLKLTAADIYLNWAEDNPAKYDEARALYEDVLIRYPSDNRAVLSMMRYHLHLGQEQEVRNLLPFFQKDFPLSGNNAQLAAEVYAALAEFFLARDSLSLARRFVEKAQNTDSRSPEAFFVKGLYFRTIGDEPKALAAFQRTLENLNGREYLSRKHLKTMILALGGIGRSYASMASHFTSERESVSDNQELAKEHYLKAIALYEDARSRNQLGRAPEYGMLYMDLGDIIYSQATLEDFDVFTLNPFQSHEEFSEQQLSNLSLSERYYSQAEAILDRGDGTSALPDAQLYRRAYSEYILNQDDALVDFYQIFRRRPDDYKAAMALALIMLQNGDYDISRNYYMRSINLMDDAVERSGNELRPDISETHQDILLRYVAAWNNLGVGRALSSVRDNPDGDYDAALNAFIVSSEYLDRISAEMASSTRDSEGRRVMEFADKRRVFADEESIPYRNRLHLLGLQSASVVHEEDSYVLYSGMPSELKRP